MRASRFAGAVAVVLAVLAGAAGPSTLSAHERAGRGPKTPTDLERTCRGLRATIVGTSRHDVLRGTDGADVIVGLGGNDVIFAGGGNDVICGGTGNDLLDGGKGDDEVYGEAGYDLLLGHKGNDRLDGGSDGFLLFGGPGIDVCTNGRPIHCEGHGGAAPTADAGPDRTVPVGGVAQLDGSRSSDPDGDPLSFRWTFLSVPAGAAPQLSDPAAVRPSFVVTRSGEHVVQLLVGDGTSNSAPDTVVVTTANSAPVAEAGPDQTALVGATATLDGGGSSDVDGGPLSYQWSLVAVPDGSLAALSSPSAVRPTFVVDVPGTYVAQLVVRDDSLESAPDTTSVTTQNSPPVANAGPDRTAFVTDTVTLDGSASSDVDGDALSFAWSLTSLPAGSAATLSDAAAVTPAFTVDLPGTYVAQLVVGDGTTASAPDTVTVSTLNSAPVADAGPDQTAFVGSAVLLDGSGSADADGDLLAFHWSLSAVPAGSAAVLSAPGTATPSFVLDRPGTYVAQLIVNDGSVDAAPDTVTITTLNSTPVARAGADQEVFVGVDVALDGGGSTDADGDPLAFRWSLTARPAGSAAVLSNPATPFPSFVPDVRGVYVAQLIVNDGTLDGVPDTVMITTVNRAPAADAGPDREARAGDAVPLDGSASSDPDGDALGYSWSFASVPAGSSAVLSDPAAQAPSFVADEPGSYVVRLVVNDGAVDSPPDEVTITAAPARISLVLLGTPFLGVGHTAQLQALLPDPAPAGGVTVTVASEAPGVASVVPPGRTFIAEGGLSGIVSVTGASPGDALFRANAAGFAEGTASLTVTNKLVELPDALSVPLGQQAVLTVTLSPDPAPGSGVIIQLTSSDPNVVAVSSSVTIQPGAFSANAIVTGARPGTATVTAENPDYATDATLVATTAELDIAEGSLAFNAGFDDTVTVQLKAAGALVPAPGPGISVAFTSSQAACAVAAPVTIPTGLANRTAVVTYGGTAALPCTAVLTAQSAGTTPDSVTITVNPAPGITVQGLPVTVGAGLQHGGGLHRALLQASNHGGVSVRIESGNPAVALVSKDANTPGTAFIEISLADGQTAAPYFVQGVEGMTGPATITVSAPRFNNATGIANIVQPGIRIGGLATTIDTLDPDDAFVVEIGPPTAGLGNISPLQVVRAGGTPVTVSLASSNPAAGELVTPSVTINPGQSNAATSFRPLSAGSTTVSASAPGFITTALGVVAITVTTPGITLQGLPVTVGAGLQHGGGLQRAVLQASNHGGVSVRVESSNPAAALVSKDANTPGTAFVEIGLADGQTAAPFFVQGVEGMTGTATITASAPGFSNATGAANIVQPGIRIGGLAATIDTLDPDDPFVVEIGPPTAGLANVSPLQNVRAGGTPVTIALASSNPAAGELVTPSVTINPGQSNAATSFRPLSAGSTTVSASAPGFITTALGVVAITVTTPGITLQGLPVTVGAGLQHGGGLQRAVLQASNHGGVSVRVESSNPAAALVSKDANTPGTAFVEIGLADGQTAAPFFVQGVEGMTGTATITASAPGFSNATGAANIVQPGIRIGGLAATIDTLDPDDPFVVEIGPPTAGLANVSPLQNVRAGGTPVTIALASSNPAAGELVTPSVTINPGQSNAATSFRPLSAGSTTVSASAPGFITTALGVVAITVTTPGITLQGLPVTVGAGLQHGGGLQRAVLQASNHGGVSVRIESSNPAVALVSRDANTPGTAFVETALADGQTAAPFFVQGVEGAEGDVVITVSAPGFTDGNGTANIVPPALRISGLVSSATAGGADDAFNVQIGTPNASGSNLGLQQSVRAGGVPVTVTVTSSQPAVGVLVTPAATAGTVTLTIGPTQLQASASFRPLAAGATTVTASAPGAITTGAGSVAVTVNP